jgi:hypothetical protein
MELKKRIYRDLKHVIRLTLTLTEHIREVHFQTLSLFCG